MPAKPTTPIVPLAELEDGQLADCFALLAASERLQTRDGKPYYRVTFRDARRSVSFPIWSDSEHFVVCEGQWKPGQFYKLRGVYRETNYGPQIDLIKVRAVTPEDEADGFCPHEFFERTRFDCDAMFDELVEIARTQIAEQPLSRLVLLLLEDNAAAIREVPAAQYHHHAYRGGFLEHVLSVTRLCVHLADKYTEYYPEMRPPLSKSLVVAGGIVHDIGKVRELRAGPDGGEYTVEGRLIGHIVQGRDMVRETATRVPDLDPETLVRLEHLILAHQNLPEWGSPKPPHTPEALLVHYADDLDAKFHMFARTLQREEVQGEFTSNRNALRRPIYRGGGPVGGQTDESGAPQLF